jgi:site-specific recombinase XerD
MAKVKWETPYRGIKAKKHPTRKYGIKPDLYFAVRFQYSGKRCESGLGWSSEGWTLDKAIIKLNELKKQAKEGEGVKTHRTRQIEIDRIKQDQKQKKRADLEKRAKELLNINEYFYQKYYPQIQKEKKIKTYQREESLFRMWIDKNIGNLPFEKITKADIENIFYDIVESGKSIRSAEYALTTLKQIWREARDGGYAPDMPVISKTMKKKISQNNNARIRFLSYDEADTLLDALKVRSIDLYEKALISLHCGLRAKEIFQLTWAHVDLEHGILNIIDSKGKDRSVHMSEQVKEMMLSKDKGKPDALVYPGRENKISGQISQTFRQIANKLFNQGVDDRRNKVIFHTLRHTYASWMVMQGINLYLVQKVLGHSTIQVTERYAHLAPDQLQLAANAIDRAVMQQKEKNIISFQKKG